MDGKKNRREGDAQMLLLQQKLDSHIDEYKQHRDEYKQHCEDEEKRWDHLIIAQERNTESIKELTEATRDIVKVWQAADGTMKTMSVLGKFVKWLSGFAVVGVAIKWVIEYFTK